MVSIQSGLMTIFRPNQTLIRLKPTKVILTKMRRMVQFEDVRQEGCFANNMDVDAAPNDGGMLAQARQRSCKANGNGCKQIKVSGPSPGDTRRGCITQFSPEEIVALKLSVLDMDRGELILIYFYVFTSIRFLHCN